MPSLTRPGAAPLSPALDPSAGEVCVTCGARVDSNFCPECGERRASDRSYSLWHFVRDHVIESVATLDGRVFRSIRTLLTQPGELTAAFMRGQRLPYLAPVQLFLLLNVLFFIWSSAVGYRIFDTPLSVHIDGQPYSVIAERMVRAKLASVSFANEKVYAARFNAIGAAQARSLLVVMVPGFALFVGLLIGRRRSPFVQHVVFALHSYAFLFVLLPVAMYAVNYPLVWLLSALNVREGQFGYDSETSIAMLVIFCTYLALAARRVYAPSRVRLAVGIPLLGMSFYVVLQGYRCLLFFVTYYST